MIKTKVQRLCRIGFFVIKTILVHPSVFAPRNSRSAKLRPHYSFSAGHDCAGFLWGQCIFEIVPSLRLILVCRQINKEIIDYLCGQEFPCVDSLFSCPCYPGIIPKIIPKNSMRRKK